MKNVCRNTGCIDSVLEIDISDVGITNSNFQELLIRIFFNVRSRCLTKIQLFQESEN